MLGLVKIQFKVILILWLRLAKMIYASIEDADQYDRLTSLLGFASAESGHHSLSKYNG